jgi:hypothetical protein
MYLSTRTQRGLSVSARTVTHDVWLRVRACPTSQRPPTDSKSRTGLTDFEP